MMIVSRDAPEYESIRESLLWNGRVPERFPELMVRPRSADEVPQIVRECADSGKMISIKSGGHDYHGACLRNGGMLLDLGGLDAVDVDSKRGEAWVEAGATHTRLINTIQEHGFAFPTGHCPTVGIGGYLLGGGLGWNATRWGPACWSIIAVRAVTVDGQQVVIDSENYSDLFWAARGGAAGFPAIATSFKLKLQPLPSIVACRLVYPVESLPSVLPWVRGIDLPGLEVSVIASRSGSSLWPGAAVATVSMTAFASSEEQARALVHRALSRAAHPDSILDEPEIVQRMFSELEGEGGWANDQRLRYGVDGGWIDEGLERVGERCARALADAPSKLSRFVFARARHPDAAPDVAFSVLGSMTVHAYATWERTADDGANREWVHTVSKELAPSLTGFWAAQADLSLSPDRARLSFRPENWKRLAKIRARYDPDQRKYGFLQ